MMRNFPISHKRKRLGHEISTGLQPKINDKFQTIKKLDEGQELLCHQALTRFFVCCGIPFWVVESPYFLDFCSNLCLNYKPLDRRTLSNDWINLETARATISIEDELTNQSRLTLGKY